MGKLLRTIARDVVAIGGVVLVAAGVAEIYTPAAMILAGAAVTAGAVLSGRRA